MTKRTQMLVIQYKIGKDTSWSHHSTIPKGPWLTRRGREALDKVRKFDKDGGYGCRYRLVWWTIIETYKEVK